MIQDKRFDSIPPADAAEAYAKDYNQQFWKTWSFAWMYVISDIRRNNRVFIVGLTAVMLVVTFLTVLQNAIQQSPIIFLRLSEQSAGELDLVLTPTSGNSNTTGTGTGTSSSTSTSTTTSSTSSTAIPLINQTEVDEAMKMATMVKGTAPRWLLLGNVSNQEDATLRSRVRIIALDTIREEEIQLGRAWPYRRLAREEILVSDSLLRELQLKPRWGDRLDLTIDFLDLLNQFSDGEQSAIVALNDLLIASGFDIDAVVAPQRQALVDALGPLANTSEPLPETIEIDRDALTLALEASGTELPGGLDPQDLPEVITLPPQLQAARDLLDSPLFTLNGTDLLEFILFNSTGLSGNESLTAQGLFTLQGEFIVHDELKNSLGRWPNVLGNIVAIDSKFIVRFFQENIDRVVDTLQDALGIFAAVITLGGLTATTTTTTANGTVVTQSNPANLNQASSVLNDFNINEFALLSIINFENRIETYLKTGAALDVSMARLSDNAMEPLGDNSRYLPALPLLFAIRGTNLIRLFLDQLFLAVMSVLVFLGCLLIYQLVISDVEEKTYEYGMLRALGMRKFTLMQLVSTHSMLFAVTGICVGLFLAFLISLYPTYFLSSFGVVEPDYNLRGLAIVVGVSLGLVMPLLSNVLPIRRALGRTLRDSLDVYHQTFNDVSVTFIKLSQLGLSPWQTSLALTMVATGFIVYYMFPWAITFNDFRLLLTLLLIILLGMVFGLTFVALMVQPMIEPLILWCLMWGKYKRLNKLVRQNMVGHRSRNSKTALMFTVSLAFLIFAGTMFTIQADTIPEQLQIIFGSDIVIQAPTIDVPLNEDLMREYLDENMQLDYNHAGGSKGRRLVENYAFRTFALNEFSEYIYDNRFANLAGLRNFRVKAYGVDRTYLKATYNQYFIPTDKDKSVPYNKVDGRDDIIESLYTTQGQGRAAFELETQPIKVGSGEMIRWEEWQDGSASAKALIAASEGEQGSGDASAEGQDGTSESGRVSAGTAPDTDPNIRQMVPGEAYKRVYDVVASEALRLPAGISRTTPTRLRVEHRVKTPFRSYKFTRPYATSNRALIRKAPGFFMSSYRFAAWGSPLFMTMDAWQEIFSKSVDNADADRLDPTWYNDFPRRPLKGALYVKLAAGVGKLQRETVINRLKSFISDDLTQVTDVVQVVESTQTAAFMIMLFFTVVGAITTVLSFFVLWTTFYANVKENAWEFGVLRSIGLTIGQLQISNIFEALSVIITAILLGSTIGFLVAITLTLQFQVFLESPFVFRVPWLIFGVMIGLSLFCAILGSYLPSRHLAKGEIAQIIRRE